VRGLSELEQAFATLDLAETGFDRARVVDAQLRAPFAAEWASIGIAKSGADTGMVSYLLVRISPWSPACYFDGLDTAPVICDC
jgi:hypothetical protein